MGTASKIQGAALDGYAAALNANNAAREEIIQKGKAALAGAGDPATHAQSHLNAADRQNIVPTERNGVDYVTGTPSSGAGQGIVSVLGDMAAKLGVPVAQLQDELKSIPGMQALLGGSGNSGQAPGSGGGAPTASSVGMPGAPGGHVRPEDVTVNPDVRQPPVSIASTSVGPISYGGGGEGGGSGSASAPSPSSSPTPQQASETSLTATGSRQQEDKPLPPGVSVQIGSQVFTPPSQDSAHAPSSFQNAGQPMTPAQGEAPAAQSSSGMPSAPATPGDGSGGDSVYGGNSGGSSSQGDSAGGNGSSVAGVQTVETVSGGGSGGGVVTETHTHSTETRVETSGGGSGGGGLPEIGAGNGGSSSPAPVVVAPSAGLDGQSSKPGPRSPSTGGGAEQKSGGRPMPGRG